MNTYYSQAILEPLGGRVVVLGLGDAMSIANEISKNFHCEKHMFEGEPISPADAFLERYKEERDRWASGKDSELMRPGAVTYDLGGFYVIHAESPSMFSLGLLVHELFHVVQLVSSSCGIRDCEFDAHLGQYLYERFTGNSLKNKEKDEEKDGLVQMELF